MTANPGPLSRVSITPSVDPFRKQQALDAGQPIIERWHDHPSLDICGPSCPAPGTGWDGSHLVIDHFPRTGGGSRE